MTKGVLVMAMVVYHSFNYSTDLALGFKYLPFLPPSFILITEISYLQAVLYPGGPPRPESLRTSFLQRLSAASSLHPVECADSDSWTAKSRRDSARSELSVRQLV